MSITITATHSRRNILALSSLLDGLSLNPALGERPRSADKMLVNDIWTAIFDNLVADVASSVRATDDLLVLYVPFSASPGFLASH